MQLLHIDSSILGDHSVSRTLSREIVEAQLRKNPGLKVVYRDLAAHPLGHITGLHMALGQGKPVDVSPRCSRISTPVLPHWTSCWRQTSS